MTSDLLVDWHVSERGAREYTALHNLGAGVRIAMLDTGISPTHPELKHQDIELVDVCSKKGTGEDKNGHGTTIASVLVGRRLGIAPAAKLISIKISCGRRPATENHLLAALEMCEKYNVDQIHLSFGGVKHYLSVKQRIDAHFRQRVLTIAASGLNRDGFCYYPGAYGNVLGVGAVKRCGIEPLAPISRETKMVDYGENVNAAWLDGTYRAHNGSSISAAITSGLVALWIAAGGAGSKADRLMGQTQLEWLTAISLKQTDLAGKKIGMLCPDRLFSLLK